MTNPTVVDTTPHPNWDARYERKAITLLAIGFGLVGLDRFIIAPLFPLIAEDLGLTYQDLGLISGVLALTWGLASVWAGNLSDRIGCKRVLVISVIAFSVLVAVSGLATGLVSLLVIRGLMGFAEGGFVPASIVATVRASKPSRVGMTVGIQQMAAPLVGLGLGPIIAIGLLRILPGWEWVFATVALPGFLVAYLIARTIKDDTGPAVAEDEKEPKKIPPPSFREAFRYRNVVFGALAMFCFLSSLHTLAAFMPNYLTDHINLSIDQMGFVFSSLGIGGVLGMIVVPAISDRLGRKVVMSAAMLLAVLALAGVIRTTNPLAISIGLFVLSSMISGVVAITIGPLINGSVPRTIAATATGIVAGLGEIFGGAIAPALAGGLAEAHGIHIIPYVSLSAAALGFVVVVFGLKEPDPAPQAAPLVKGTEPL
ncbi:MAG: MFS transporter [Pseudomonadota bacterium]